MNAPISLTLFKLRKTRESQHREYVIRKYKQEIMDWCGHDLACQLVADKLNMSERLVRNIVSDVTF